MHNKSKESKVINFGCRLNSYESESIKDLIKKNNIQNTIVFNTCAVTNEAERQARQAIRKYKRENPEMKIVVTGCSAQINSRSYLSMGIVDNVIGNNEKVENFTWKNLNKLEHNYVKNIMEVKKINHNIVENFDGMARAYVEVQQGCNHRCTFCSIPYGRGNNRSAPVGLIVNRVRNLVEKGFNEIVLTGVDITDYGIDLPGKPSLSRMIKRLLKLIPNLKQLRLSSIDCAEVDDDFWDLLCSEKRFMPHLHISLQSGDNMILKRMKRRHTREEAINFCNRAKKLRPNIVFGADLIAGFPTETDEMFNNTCKLIEECKILLLHVFPYSKREMTPAKKMPQIPENVIKQRAKKLRSIGEKNISNYLQTLVGEKKVTLIEKSFENYSIGKTQEYIPIKIDKKLDEGMLINVKIKNVKDKILYA